jgi:hypothetical protein
MSDEHEQDDIEPTRERVIDRRDASETPRGTPPKRPAEVPGDDAPEDLEGEVGAEGGSHSPSNHTSTPFQPADDGTPLGDTDQHSNA